MGSTCTCTWRPWVRSDSALSVSSLFLMALLIASWAAGTCHGASNGNNNLNRIFHHKKIRRAGSGSGPFPLVTGCGRGGTHSTAASLKDIGVPAVHESFASSSGGVTVGWPFAAHVEKGDWVGYEWEPVGRYPFERENSAKQRWAGNVHFSPVVQLVRNPLDVISSTRRCFCAKGIRTSVTIKNDNRSWWFVEAQLNLTQILHETDTDGKPLQWSDLSMDDIRRSMVYWYGWNRLVEKTHRLSLAGYDGADNPTVPETGPLTTANHVVQLEDPQGLEKIARLLKLSDSKIAKARSVGMEKTAQGSSNAKYAKAFGRVTWKDLWDAAPGLAQKIWSMAQRYGYHSDDSAMLVEYLHVEP